MTQSPQTVAWPWRLAFGLLAMILVFPIIAGVGMMLVLVAAGLGLIPVSWWL